MGQSLMWPWNMDLTCEVVIFYQGCNFPLWNSYIKYIIVLIISWVHQKLVSCKSGHMRLNCVQKKHILIWSEVIWTWSKRFFIFIFLNLRLWMTFPRQMVLWCWCLQMSRRVSVRGSAVLFSQPFALFHSSILCALVMLTLFPQIQAWSRTWLPIFLYIL